jgi:hypothetical protein
MLHRTGNLIYVMLLCIPLLLNGCSGSSNGEANAPETGVETGAINNPGLMDNPVDTSSHDNIVILKRGDNSGSPHNLSFAMLDYNITSGQPWHGVTSSFSDGQLSIDVNCGRHQSGGPQTWFGNWIADNQAPFIDASNQNWPSNKLWLNFAVSGTLSIDGNNYGICLAQYGAGEGQNPWYLAGAHFKKGGPGTDAQIINPDAQIITPDGKYVILPGITSGSNHTFTVWVNS